MINFQFNDADKLQPESLKMSYFQNCHYLSLTASKISFHYIDSWTRALHHYEYGHVISNEYITFVHIHVQHLFERNTQFRIVHMSNFQNEILYSRIILIWNIREFESVEDELRWKLANQTLTTVLRVCSTSNGDTFWWSHVGANKTSDTLFYKKG